MERADPAFFCIYNKEAPPDKPNLHVCKENGAKVCSCTIYYPKNILKTDRKKHKIKMIQEIKVSQLSHYRLCGKSYAHLRNEVDDFNKWLPDERKIALPDLIEKVVHQY